MPQVAPLLWSAIIILASTRGLFVYHLGIAQEIVYPTSAVLLVALGLYAIAQLHTKGTHDSLNRLKAAVEVNYAISIPIILVLVALSGQPQRYISQLYQFAIFPTIFLLLRSPDRILRSTIHLVAVVTAIGIIEFNLFGDYRQAVEANQILRDTAESVSTISQIVLSGGYLGDNHDAANLMVLCTTFYLSQCLITRGWTQATMAAAFCGTLYVTLLTGSAANTTVLVAVSLVSILIYAFSTVPHVAKTSRTLLLLLALVVSLYNPADRGLLTFTEKYVDQTTLEEGGMLNALDPSSIARSLPSIIVGMGEPLDAPIIRSEVAFVKILATRGVGPFVLLMFILLGPIASIRRFNEKHNYATQLNRTYPSTERHSILGRMHLTYRTRVIPQVIPVLAGVLTLIHFGGLFRVTSIGVFCTLSALFYSDATKAESTMTQYLADANPSISS